MASEEGGKIFANRGNGSMSSDYGQRAAHALDRAVPGPNRDKAIARIFECSPRMARYLRCGLYWTVERLNIASARVKDFDAYLASPDFQTRLDEIERELGEMRQHLRGEDHGR